MFLNDSLEYFYLLFFYTWLLRPARVLILLASVFNVHLVSISHIVPSDTSKCLPLVPCKLYPKPWINLDPYEVIIGELDLIHSLLIPEIVIARPPPIYHQLDRPISIGTASLTTVIRHY